MTGFYNLSRMQLDNTLSCILSSHHPTEDFDIVDRSYPTLDLSVVAVLRV
jgi:hypothetical protein